MVETLAVDRPADLLGAWSAHGAVRFVEPQARFVPLMLCRDGFPLVSVPQAAVSVVVGIELIGILPL